MSRVGYAIVGAAAAAYLTARAALVPITYDEAATLVRYVEGGVTAIFDFNVATNHWLNTALTWLSARVFGTAPWALRLPAVIAGFGFIVFAAAIARRAESTIVGISGFVLMVANPYLLDYLALSRGYGIALCLLTASLYYLLAWCDHAPDSPGARRALVRSVWLAAAAVLATFTVLPAFLALIAVVTGRLLWTAGPRRATTGAPPSGLASWRVLAAWLVVAAGVSLMVFSRQEVLSADLFTPISVRTVGLFAAENDQVRVFRVDAKGRVRPFERDGPDAWRSDPGRNAWSLRIELPVSVDRNLTSLEVTIGPRVFRRDRRKDGPWTAWDSGPDRLLRSTAALSAPRSAVPTVSGSINWGGDAGQWRLAARHTAVLVGFLAIGAALLAGVASLGTRAGWIDHGSAGVILSAVVAMAGLTAAPLYLLRRDA